MRDPFSAPVGVLLEVVISSLSSGHSQIVCLLSLTSIIDCGFAIALFDLGKIYDQEEYENCQSSEAVSIPALLLQLEFELFW